MANLSEIEIDAKYLVRKRIYTYVVLFLGLFFGYLSLRMVDWHGSATLHTVMETVATTLAIIVGALALTRFYSQKNSTFLFIGVGFLGTGFLDGYHTIVTSAAFDTFYPSPLPSLIPWSWLASRIFLSIALFLSWWFWKREKASGGKKTVSENNVYFAAGLLTLASFAFFAFVPLPIAYFPNLFFGRPEEFIPAFFFLLALVGYLKKGWWKHDSFEHWLVMALIISFMAQAMFMSLSFELFDMEFDMAHLLKKLSYIFVLTGLIISLSSLIGKVESSRVELAKHNKRLNEANEMTKKALQEAKGSKAKAEKALLEAQKSKEEADKSIADLEGLNASLVGRELKMIQLKEEIEGLKSDGEKDEKES